MFNILTRAHMICDYIFTITKAMAFRAIKHITTTVMMYIGEKYITCPLSVCDAVVITESASDNTMSMNRAIIDIVLSLAIFYFLI